MDKQAVQNFQITAAGIISDEFRKRAVVDFNSALHFIRNLPYGRNSNKHNLVTVFADNCGTCSTKHALLKQLAEENNIHDVTLVLGLFRMNAVNTPAVSGTLASAKLEYIPEAHCYLKVDGKRVDVMKANSSPEHFVHDLIEEREIRPGQIAEDKVDYHKRHLRQWLDGNPGIVYTLDELWAIRERCIEDLEE